MDPITDGEREALLSLLNAEWADIHHSRLQEWSALGAVTAAHLGISQMPRLLGDAASKVLTVPVAVAACVAGIALALLGGLMTCRHRGLMQERLGWIYDAELLLGLVKTPEHPSGVVPASARMRTNKRWHGLVLPRLLSTSGLILAFYGLFVVFDVACLVLLLVRGLGA